MMHILMVIFFVMVLLSSGVLAFSGLKALLRDIFAIFEAGGAEGHGAPRRSLVAVLAVEVGLTLAGLAGAAGSLIGLGRL